MSQQVYVFDVTLEDDPDVRRTVAVRSDQTLVDLHVVLGKAFGWHGDFPYTFLLGDARYTSPLTASFTSSLVGLMHDRRVLVEPKARELDVGGCVARLRAAPGRVCGRRATTCTPVVAPLAETPTGSVSGNQRRC
jgi:hypothetical protein